MRRIYSWIAVGLVVASAVDRLQAAPPAPRQAKQRPARFQPNRPTVSPYLNLFRNDNNAVPNYHLYVRPIEQQRAINEQQQAVNRAQLQTAQRVGQELKQVQQGSAAPTGIGGGYGNYLHFYPGLQ